MTKSRDPLRMAVEPSEVTLSSGAASATIEVRVANLSTVVDEFVVWVTGDAPWLEAPAVKVRALPNHDAVAQLTLGVRDGEVPSAGVWPVTVRVRSASSGAVEAEGVRVHVPAVPGAVSASLERTVVRGGATARTTLLVRSGGNSPLHVALEGRDAEGEVAFRIHPAEVDLAPRGTSSSVVELSARRPWRGGERHRPFTVTAAADGRRVEASGTFVQAPTFSRGALAALRAALTLGGGLGLVGAAFLPWTGAPPRFEGWQWSYARYTAALDLAVPQPPAVLVEPFMTMLTSAGLVVSVLGVLAILGLMGRGGRLTMLAGGGAVVFVAVFVGLLAARGGGGPASGAGAAVAAGLVAVAGGALAEG